MNATLPPALADAQAQLLEQARTQGYAVIRDACSRAQVDPDAFLVWAHELYRWARRERLLSDRACRLFDEEALRRGLDPLEAAEDIESARPIEQTPVVARAWRLVDRAEAKLREQQFALPEADCRAVLGELHAALNAKTSLCTSLPAHLAAGVDNEPARQALERAFRWVPAALVAEAEQVHRDWQRFDLGLPTGASPYAHLVWLAAWRGGTGSGSGAVEQLYDGLFGMPVPRAPRPLGCAAVVHSRSDSDSSASYSDWPRPQINFYTHPSPSLAVHELAHWLERRAQPLLAVLQYAHLRARQLAPLRKSGNAWAAEQAIPAGMIDHYQECWYADGAAPPLNYEVLSTTLEALEAERTSVFKDVETLAVCLGGLVVSSVL